MTYIWQHTPARLTSFRVLTAATIKNGLFLEVTSCDLVDWHQTFAASTFRLNFFLLCQSSQQANILGVYLVIKHADGLNGQWRETTSRTFVLFILPTEGQQWVEYLSVSATELKGTRYGKKFTTRNFISLIIIQVTRPTTWILPPSPPCTLFGLAIYDEGCDDARGATWAGVTPTWPEPPGCSNTITGVLTQVAGHQGAWWRLQHVT
jgi:hypothetical protein